MTVNSMRAPRLAEHVRGLVALEPGVERHDARHPRRGRRARRRSTGGCSAPRSTARSPGSRPAAIAARVERDHELRELRGSRAAPRRRRRRAPRGPRTSRARAARGPGCVDRSRSGPARSRRRPAPIRHSPVAVPLPTPDGRGSRHRAMPLDPDAARGHRAHGRGVPAIDSRPIATPARVRAVAAMPRVPPTEECGASRTARSPARRDRQ